MSPIYTADESDEVSDFAVTDFRVALLAHVKLTDKKTARTYSHRYRQLSGQLQRADCRLASGASANPNGARGGPSLSSPPRTPKFMAGVLHNVQNVRHVNHRSDPSNFEDYI